MVAAGFNGHGELQANKKYRFSTLTIYYNTSVLNEIRLVIGNFSNCRVRMAHLILVILGCTMPTLPLLEILVILGCAMRTLPLQIALYPRQIMRSRYLAILFF